MRSLSVLSLLFLSLSVFGAPDVAEIVQKSNLASYYAGDDGQAHVNMSTLEKGGAKTTRDLVISRKDVKDGGNQFFFVYFRRPAMVAKTAFLVHKHVGQDDDRWMYFPANNRVVRLSASDKRSSFVGSAFVYEDVSGRGIEEDHHELLEETEEHYVIKNTPKNPDEVKFEFYKVWIDKKTFLPMKGEYTKKGGGVYRRMTAKEVETIDGHPTVTEVEMSDDDFGKTTTLKFRQVQYNEGLHEREFTERSLSNPGRLAR